MAWALETALKHEAKRIIYVIPYTSIITQTAGIFREIFGEENVLEHHSDISFSGGEILPRGRALRAHTPISGELGGSNHRDDERTILREPLLP